jgi:hypothetical protein
MRPEFASGHLSATRFCRESYGGPLILVGLCVLCAGLVSVIAGLVGVGIAITNGECGHCCDDLDRQLSGSWRHRMVGHQSSLTQYRVVVRHQASEPIERAALTGGGISVPIGEIKPGASVTRKFYFTGDGTLIFSGELNRKQLNTVVEGYVTNSVGGDKEIRVFMDGAIDVRSK